MSAIATLKVDGKVANLDGGHIRTHYRFSLVFHLKGLFFGITIGQVENGVNKNKAHDPAPRVSCMRCASTLARIKLSCRHFFGQNQDPIMKYIEIPNGQS